MNKTLPASHSPTENEILQKALRAFGHQTGISVKELPVFWLELNESRYLPDARLRLNTEAGDVDFIVDIKSELQHSSLDRLLHKMQGQAISFLLVCRYIPKPLKEELRARGLSYMESTGNCFIQSKGLHIFINDQPASAERNHAGGKLWKPAGLKFLFPILLNPDLLNAPYRSMAKAGGIALGNVGAFIDELKREGYVKTAADGKFFIENAAHLQQKWIGLFGPLLRPRLKPGRFRYAKPGTQDWRALPAVNFRWGAEPAGALLTNFLNPEQLTIYTRVPKSQLMKELRLLPDEDGPVEILDCFWDEEVIGKNAHYAPAVPPLLAYAELASSFDSRNREVADKIRAKFLMP